MNFFFEILGKWVVDWYSYECITYKLAKIKKVSTFSQIKKVAGLCWTKKRQIN